MRRSDETAIVMLLLLVAFGASTKRARARSAFAWSDEDMWTFSNYVKQSGVPPEVALQVYTAESGLNPAASSGIAFGLAQMTGATLRDLGWSESAKAFARLSVANQAPWIMKLLQYQSKAIGFVPSSALDLYVANLSPAAARARADIIYRQDNPAQKQAYQNNANLDTGRKGYIDRSDLQRVLSAVEYSDTYRLALEQLKRVQ